MAVRIPDPTSVASAQMSKMQQVEVATMIAGGAVLAGTALWAWGTAKDAWACYRTPAQKTADAVKGVLAKASHTAKGIQGKVKHAAAGVKHEAQKVSKAVAKTGWGIGKKIGSFFGG